MYGRIRPPFSAARPFDWLGRLAVAYMLLTSTGCVGTLVNLMHAAKGNTVPAAYTGLKGKRVAVVCVSNSEAFGPAEASLTLSRNIGKLIAMNVDEVTLVDPQKIAEWIDRNDWDYQSYKAIGKGVDAEMVVAIDLDSFSLYEGRTLYKGRAEANVVVYDMTQGGSEVFSYAPNSIQYPENTSRPTTEMSERAFRREFINVLSHRIARQFYPYDAADDFARDSSLVASS